MTDKLNEARTLGNLRVLEVGGEVGAWCGKLLADMGAEVVKIEPPSGDPTRAYGPFYEDKPGLNRSLYFWHYNTNKKSLTLNLSLLSGQALFKSFARTADVIIDSFPPRHLDSLGIGYAELQRLNPRLVMTAITPFGQQGPYSDYEATDLTVLAFGGPAWSCGYDDHSIPPVRGGGNQGYHTACHFAAISTLTALLYRNRTGLGQFIDVNMHAAANVTTEGATYQWLMAQETVQRQTGRHAGIRHTPSTQVQCRDGVYLNLGLAARTEEEWFRLVAWLSEEGVIEGDLSDYLTPPNRQALFQGDRAAIEQYARIEQAVHALARKKDGYELFREAQSRDFQWGIIYSPDEVLDDPHFQERGFVVAVEHPEFSKTFRYPGAPYKFTASPWAIRRRAPTLGEDNHDIYVKELGLKPEDLVTLSEASVI